MNALEITSAAAARSPVMRSASAKSCAAWRSYNVGDEGMDEVYPRAMNWIIKNFLRGLVIVVPIAITIYVVFEAFMRIDRLLRRCARPALGFAID